MSNILSFDEARLKAELERLPKNLRLAFAAACAERFFPGYVSYAASGGRANTALLRAALDAAWCVARGEEVEMDLEAVAARCDELIPNDDDYQNPFAAYADDAAAAVILTLGVAVTGSVQDAAWAARCGYDSLDSYLTELLGIDPSQPESLDVVLAHPLVQAEFARQERDLKELLSSGPDTKRVVEEIRERAVEEARFFFKIDAQNENDSSGS